LRLSLLKFSNRIQFFSFLHLSFGIILKASIDCPIFISEGIGDKFLDTQAEIVSGVVIFDFLPEDYSRFIGIDKMARAMAFS
jgi:hypothetical protein